MQTPTVLGSSRLIGIVRFHEGGDVSGAVDALARGGIELLEITIDTPGALEAVERAADDGRAVGVGTVLTPDQVDRSAAAGARFVVSPGFSADVVARARELGLEPIPGALTATEIMAATAAGARVVKLFPASPSGTTYLRSLRGPFPDVAFVPTGGIGIEEIRPYLDAGAAAVALGGELVGRTAPGPTPTSTRSPSGRLGRSPPCRPALRTCDADRRARDPVLVADLDAVERNIAGMQAYCDEHGLALRPHVKTHKLPQLARLQVDAGARGITCQKLGEAEVFVDAGFDDILISFPLVGEAKAERLAALAGRARIAVVGDSVAVAEGLSAVLAREGVELEFLVECDTGLGRAGVQTPDEAAALAAVVDTLGGLRFAGLITYPSPPEAAPWLRAAREVVERAGLAAGRVTVGGTPTAKRAHELGLVDELRVGTYVYGDRACLANGSVPLEDCALRVLATVVSRPTRDRAILDAGSKALTSDLAIGQAGHGQLVEYPEAEVYKLNEEHGYVDVSGCPRPPEIGERVTVIPNHACTTANLYDEVVVHRRGDVVDVFATAARGKLT